MIKEKNTQEAQVVNWEKISLSRKIYDCPNCIPKIDKPWDLCKKHKKDIDNLSWGITLDNFFDSSSLVEGLKQTWF